MYSYAVTATYPDGEESGFSNVVDARPESDSVHEESWDDGTAEEGFNSGGSSTYIAVKYTAVDEGEQLKRVKWYQMAPGGAFYFKVWEDDNGLPGQEIISAVQVSGNEQVGMKEILQQMVYLYLVTSGLELKTLVQHKIGVWIQIQFLEIQFMHKATLLIGYL